MSRSAEVVHFRLWPPVALGLPLTAGLVASSTIGDPWELPAGAAVVGWVLVAAFAVWNGWTMLFFARARTGLLPGQATTELMTTGPFARSRNPLYLGLVALYVGIALIASSFWALALTPAAVAAVEWGAIRPEEGHLRARFGPRYEAYSQRVRRWL